MFANGGIGYDGDMYKHSSKRPATQEEVMMFTLTGQALINIQAMEECLSVCITIKHDVKHPSNYTKEETEEILKKRRSHTLGKAVKIVVKNKLYNDNLLDKMEVFLKERNWLVHKSIEEFYDPTIRMVLYQRLGKVSQDANEIQGELTEDLVEYSEEIGINMDSLREAIAQWERDYG